MYIQFFRLTREPFSISPDPRYLFMSQRHHEALAHLLYGTRAGGGVVLLTGEIGTGKTTICRCLLEQMPVDCSVGYIFNPKLTVVELLQSICEEFRIPLEGRPRASGVKEYIDALNRHLLAAHGAGRNSVLIIDEAQNLSTEVLEQLRLLTNLETNERKLLQIVLIGQPELRDKLAQPELEQLAQRVIARYHLEALTPDETASYIQHRLSTAGLSTASPFQPSLMRRIHQLTNGVPRRINLLCDRALLGAYAQGRLAVDRGTLEQAARELFVVAPGHSRSRRRRRHNALALASIALIAGVIIIWIINSDVLRRTFDNDVLARDMPPTAAHVEPMALVPVAQAAPAASPGVIFSEQGGARAAALQSKKEALRQLAQAWGTTLPDGAPCETARQSELHCYVSNGGIAELRRLNRPAVLKLLAADGAPCYAILDGLSDAYASLRVGNLSQTVSLVVLARHFPGEFSTFWRMPGDFGEFISRGSQGPAVEWVARQLAKANHVAPPSFTAPSYDATLEAQVRELQQAQGLDVDGVVGPVTFMQLNRIAGVNEPRLHVKVVAPPVVAAAGG